MTSNLKKWIANGALDKGDREEDNYRILRHFFMQKEGRLYLNKDGIVNCKRREEDKILCKYNAIVLPQLYQTELLFRSHDQMGHQKIDKVYQRIMKRFEWPGMKKACEKWVTACLPFQQVKDPRKLRFQLQSIESSEFNDVVQIDHQKICMTDSGYGPGDDRSLHEICRGRALHNCLSRRDMRRFQVAQAASTTHLSQTNGLVERQNRTLVPLLRVYCSTYMTDWDR